MLVDLPHMPEGFYFGTALNLSSLRLSLAATLPHALTLAGAGRRSSSREVRLAADMLTSAVESLALRLDRTYLRPEPRYTRGSPPCRRPRVRSTRMMTDGRGTALT